MQNIGHIQIKQVPEKMDVQAPDMTEIRLLANMNRGSMVHCVLPPAQVSLAGIHQTVEEMWYVLQGQGEVWLKRQNEEREEAIIPDISFTIPAGTQFQVRNTGSVPLCFVIVTMPPWPGEQEWVRVVDHWSVQ
ncbi:cupin domain-containing protein [Ktedonobacteria bacterium brp13]|nr:cupin domain-containing protein [Ktedonobacteria bacterium brp13]